MSEPITSEMEAMLLFRKHKQTTWRMVKTRPWSEFHIGPKELSDAWITRLINRGLIVNVWVDIPGAQKGGSQYRLAEKFR